MYWFDATKIVVGSHWVINCDVETLEELLEALNHKTSQSGNYNRLLFMAPEIGPLLKEKTQPLVECRLIEAFSELGFVERHLINIEFCGLKCHY